MCLLFMYTSIVTIYVGGGGCGISLHLFLIFHLKAMVFTFQDSRLFFPIFTLEFNRWLRNLNFSISTLPAQGRGRVSDVKINPLAILSGKKNRERIGRRYQNAKPSLWTSLHLPWKFQDRTYYEQLSIDLWPDFQGHVKRNLRSAAFRHLPLANFGIFA